MYFQNKKAFTLLELIFTLVISSIILFSTMGIFKVLHQENEKTFNLTLDKIDFETTRLFLEKKIEEDSTLSNLTLSETILLYNGDILIKEITSFTKTEGSGGITITLCKKSGFCTEIYIKKETLTNL